MRQHTQWCDGSDADLDLDRCQHLVGHVQNIAVYVSGLPGVAPLVSLPALGGEPIRLTAADSRLLVDLVITAADVADIY